jgi:N-acetylmuramoyl-L-alanine amidase
MNIIKLDRKPTLEFDPGHGGNDRWNRGKKWIEADGTLLISKKVAGYLPKGKFNIIFTRQSDATVSLTERAAIAVRNKADLLISRHTNSGGGRGGTEVFYSVDIPGDKQYAAALSKNISAALGVLDRGAKTRESVNYPGEDYYSVIDGAQDGGVPHVFIVEYAFHDVATDEAKLLNNAILDKACKAEAKFICEMFGIAFVEPTIAKEKWGVVTADVLNVRSAMTSVNTKNIIGTLVKGQKVQIEKLVGDWYSTYYGNHGGYVSAKYIKLI